MNKIFTVDAHAGGEPCRVIHSGLENLAGATMSERRASMRIERDWVRTGLTHEPRGHRGMFGAVLTPPVRRDSAFGLIFFDPVGYLDGCGHGTLCSVAVWRHLRGTLAVPFNIDNPDDSVTSVLAITGDENHCTIELAMPPATVLSDHVRLPQLNGSPGALVQCGNKFLIIEAAAAGIPDLHRTSAATAERVALRLGTIAEERSDPGMDERTEILLYQELEEPSRAFATFVLFNGSQIDRSPCGTGSAALATLLLTRGQLGEGEKIDTIGPAGAPFTVQASRPDQQLRTVEVRLRGTAHITGVHQWIFSSADVLAPGYLLS